MTGHLGYEKHHPAGRGSGNSRNGSTPKTVLTDVGAVGLAVPRDRAGSFEPKIVRKGQARLEGFNERIIALYARGITTRDIRAHLRESGATRRWPGCGAAARILSPAWPEFPPSRRQPVGVCGGTGGGSAGPRIARARECAAVADVRSAPGREPDCAKPAGARARAHHQFARGRPARQELRRSRPVRPAIAGGPVLSRQQSPAASLRRPPGRQAGGTPGTEASRADAASQARMTAPGT